MASSASADVVGNILPNNTSDVMRRPLAHRALPASRGVCELIELVLGVL
eukprot:CAMPEP_0170504916 /NCGR_PEP_ID=MMETSP0208-20121228/49286_1 /TAXON_ID=197538 /ORGANISM="Strombidium inclinatum, Strain S3" /LENGTH=48 /DNA_ID= /DNA_START= /DNA_END= /DNA_ORIENTATION=